MTGYDAIVIGAGHNSLAAAVMLQKAGLRTLCLDAKLYAGGMASTVELFDGLPHGCARTSGAIAETKDCGFKGNSTDGLHCGRQR